MPGRSYSLAQRAEAIALSDLIGVKPAAIQMRIDVRTLRDWREAAGKRPEIDLPPDEWREIGGLAKAQLKNRLASGKVNPVSLATIGAISDRRAAEIPAPIEPKTPEEVWGDQIEAALVAAYGEDTDLAMLAILEADPFPDDPLKYLAGLGDLHAWRAAHDAAERAAWEAQFEANRLAAEASRLAALDAETRQLLEEAERYLTEHAG